MKEGAGSRREALQHALCIGSEAADALLELPQAIAVLGGELGERTAEALLQDDDDKYSEYDGEEP